MSDHVSRKKPSSPVVLIHAFGTISGSCTLSVSRPTCRGVQAATEMHALTTELADTSDGIARTMAEAAAASLLSDLPGMGESPGEDEKSKGDASGDTPAVPAAVPVQGDASLPHNGIGRCREDAQAEVERLKARQLELYILIRDKREVR